MTRDTVAGACQITAGEKSAFGKRVEGGHQPSEIVVDSVFLAQPLDLFGVFRISRAMARRHLDGKIRNRRDHAKGVLEVLCVGVAEDAGLEHGRHGPITRDELGRLLVAYARNPRQAVRGVTAQDCVVRVGAARYGVAPRDLGLVDLHHAALLRVEDDDVAVANEAEQVAVTTGDLDGRLHLGGERRNDVLRLIALESHDIDPDRFQRLHDDRHLRDQGRWDRLRGPVLFVAGDQIDAPGGPPVLVGCERSAARLTVSDVARQGVEGASQRVDEGAVRPARGLRERVERTEKRAGSVDLKPRWRGMSRTATWSTTQSEW